VKKIDTPSVISESSPSVRVSLTRGRALSPGPSNLESALYNVCGSELEDKTGDEFTSNFSQELMGPELKVDIPLESAESLASKSSLEK
jgi:hypothetical protein